LEGRVDERIGSLEKMVDERIGSLEKRVNDRINSLEKRVDGLAEDVKGLKIEVSSIKSDIINLLKEKIVRS